MAPLSPVSDKAKTVSPRPRPLSSQPSPAGSRNTSPTKSPSSVTPVSNLRPRPPSTRSRRSSLAASASASPRASPAPRPQRLQSSSSDASNGPESERFTGNVEERTEDELSKASREALQDALRREWTDREKLLARLEDLDAAQRTYELRIAELERSNEGLQTKFDAGFADQAHLESELEGANELVDLLRSNLLESEKQCRLGARRYADQEKAFEAERTVHHADQQHLIQRIKSLTTERIANPRESSEAQAALQEELASLTASHRTLVAQLTTLADQLHEIKGENVRLTEENASWQLLIEERTLAGTMRGGLIEGGDVPSREGSSTPSSSILRKESSALDTLEEQMEMDELNGELDSHHHPIFDESDRAHPIRGSSQAGNYVDLSSPTRANGAPLASELGSLATPMEAESLRNEVKTLKEANKALQLYCSKILDRILAQEGYEHVLSVDYRSIRGTRTAVGKKTRPSLHDIAQREAVESPTELPAARPKEVPLVPQVMPAPRARPTSMYAPAPSATVPPPEKKDDKDKRARRGFSIDFRSLGFGLADKPETKPQLRPLQLASRASVSSTSPTKSDGLSPIPTSSSAMPKLSRMSTAPLPPPPAKPVISTPASASVSPIPGARKLEPQEEDEEDRRARSLMEAQLKLAGISADPTPTATAESKGAAAWIRRLRPSSSNTTTVEQSSPTTPVAEAEAALRAFDAAEKEQARLLAKGKSAERDSYTAPPRMTPRRHRSSNSQSSVGGGAGGGNAEETGHKTRGSGSTLWSMGSTQE